MAEPSSNALHRLVCQMIKTQGPLSVSDFMATCLMHPDHGYYQKQVVFGEKGDFITAPEVSQMFGEMIGVYLINQWQKLGEPAHCHLVELGPGRGTLMADILKTFALAPALQQGISVHFVETSQQLRALQKEKVQGATWHDDLSTLPDDAPILLVANEFFDALPIMQFQKHRRVWRERAVDMNEEHQLVWALKHPNAGLHFLDKDFLSSAQDGDIVEVCPQAISITQTIADMLRHQSGCAVIIDYGYAKTAFGDSLQALQGHQYVDPLQHLGEADLTAHVNFDSLATVFFDQGIATDPLYEQGQWLMGIGMGQRAEALAKGQSPDHQKAILEALKRLTAPDQMGQLFKVLCAFHKSP